MSSLLLLSNSIVPLTIFLYKQRKCFPLTKDSRMEAEFLLKQWSRQRQVIYTLQHVLKAFLCYESYLSAVKDHFSMHFCTWLAWNKTLVRNDFADYIFRRKLFFCHSWRKKKVPFQRFVWLTPWSSCHHSKDSHMSSCRFFSDTFISRDSMGNNKFKMSCEHKEEEIDKLECLISW